MKAVSSNNKTLKCVAAFLSALVFLPIIYLLVIAALTYFSIGNSINVLLEKNFGIERYRIKKETIRDFLFEPSGRWWVELDVPLDTKALEESSLRFFRPEYLHDGRDDQQIKGSREIDEYIHARYGYPASGFGLYQSEDQVLGEGLTLCNTKGSCFIRVFAKEGDINLFVQISGE